MAGTKPTGDDLKWKTEKDEQIADLIRRVEILEQNQKNDRRR